MLSLAIDFGTSNCAAFLADGKGTIVPIPLEGEGLLLPSVIFSEGNEHDGVVTQQKNQGPILFGKAALQAYYQDPLSGTLIRSPKSFLGSTIDDRAQAYFQVAIENILRHIKTLAEAHPMSLSLKDSSGKGIESVILGRPVNFQGAAVHDGNSQAVSIMSNAAKAVGFTDIQFLMEPMAAALEFERTLTAESTVLIVDIGGGTTDCVVLQSSPERYGQFDRAGDVLAQSGDRVGGTDFDQSLAWHSLMPLLGRDEVLPTGMPIPNSMHMDAICTRDVPAQYRFSRSQRKIELLIKEVGDSELLERFLWVQENNLQHRLISSAENAKIELSSASDVVANLDFVEEGLAQAINRDDFEVANTYSTRKVLAVVQEALDQASKKPNLVFVTGGMGNSPMLRAHIANLIGDQAQVKAGDMLCSVGRGLGIYANQYSAMRLA
ncbi:MAG: molecular chaperone [Limnobacter sp.]|nr:molecular chaperone [Limnobacter sp.]